MFFLLENQFVYSQQLASEIGSFSFQERLSSFSEGAADECESRKEVSS